MPAARLSQAARPAPDRPVPAPGRRGAAVEPGSVAGTAAVERAGLGLRLERALGRKGFRQVVGVDEVGRGPLAGPVTAAAVVLDVRRVPRGLADSKALSPERRDEIYQVILAEALAVAVGFATAAEIDRINIRQATFLAMRRALAALPLAPDYLLVDGRDLPGGWTGPGEAIVKGDAICASIAAASIVAKVLRDRLMLRQHRHDPRYGFDRHKGYATPDHREALLRHGASPFHRQSFAPCAGDLFTAIAD